MSTSPPRAEHANAFRKLLRELGKEELFPTSLLEQYPHIFDKIFLLWGDPPSSFKYFDELLTTHRENRAGFPHEIYTEIFTLDSYYSYTHPTVEKNDDFWSGVNKRD